MINAAYDELEDFDSEAFKPVGPSDHSYVKGMWGSFRPQGINKDLAKDVVLAHGMVQSFVNAFARDGRYVVVFDKSVSTAGTDIRAKFVVITPGPIADMNLTPEEAGVILTGLAVHEISHPRYGRMTSQAVENVFPGNAAASRLSNLLDDIRIERRFVTDYPGYSGIFLPVLDYIGKAGLKRDGLEIRVPSLGSPVNLAIGATRYPQFSDWSDPAAAAEFAWWNDWADRGAVEDAPKRHVDFVREALAHIVGSGGGGMSDSQLNRASQVDVPAWDPAATEDQVRPDDPCSGSAAVEKAAAEGDTDQGVISKLKKEADGIIEAARNVEDDGHGLKVDVNRSLRGITSGGPRGVPSQVASRYIRSAIMQSRTGHTDHAPFKRHGRLDQRGLARTASQDFRIFEKRTATSPGKYDIWVLVDASDSMTWGSGYGSSPLCQAAGVAHAMAAASQSVPTVRMSVWAWTDPFRVGSLASAGAALAWKTGMPLEQVLRLSTVKTGGTPDSTIMGWAARAVLRDVLPGETPVLIVASDGSGSSDMNQRIEEARKMGVEVYGVSFGRSVDDSARYGRANYVQFDKSVEQTSRGLAKLFTRITGVAR